MGGLRMGHGEIETDRVGPMNIVDLVVPYHQQHSCRDSNQFSSRHSSRKVPLKLQLHCHQKKPWLDCADHGVIA